jgi:hypothetical protein
MAALQFQGKSPEELYAREKETLQSGRIIPLAHVPEGWAIGPSVDGWGADLFGGWRLADVWLGGMP